MDPALPERASPAAVLRHRGLVARTVLVATLTLLSRLLGFVREALMAAVFGDRSVVSDAFITAWRVPNLFRRMLGEGALAVALQNAMTRADLEHGDAAGRALFRSTLRTATWLLLGLCALAMLVVALLPDAMPFTGWAWLGSEPGAVRDLTLRLLPYVVLVCVAALCGGALAVRGHFALPSLAPTVMNLCWIAALVAIGLASNFGRDIFGGDTGATPGAIVARQWELARVLAWGLLLGGTLQLVLHLVPLGRFGLLGETGGERAAPGPVLRATVPLVIGAAIYQINVLVDGLMANALLAPGGSSALYYANRVQQFPLALVATAAVNAVFPLLNAHGHLGERGRVRALHDRAQLGILFLALPAAAGLFALALPIASVCYEHGNYGAEGTLRVAAGLRWLAVALVPAGAIGLTSRTFVAMGDLVTPVRIAGAMVALNVALNTLAVVGLGLDVAGLTLATAVTSWANLLWLLAGLRRKLALPAAERELVGRVARIATAALSCAAVAWLAHHLTASALGLSEGRRSVAALFVGLGASALAYGLAAHLLGIPEWRDTLGRLRDRAAPRE